MPRRNKQRPIRAQLPTPNCQHKKRYGSLVLVEQAIERHEQLHGVPDTLRSYHCSRCNGWHLTSTDR